MRSLLAITAVLETATGVALLAMPALLVSILLRAPLDLPAGAVVGRVGGAALVALGFVCWRARQDEHSQSAIGVVIALSFYNVAAVAILAYAWLGEGLGGIVLWMAVFAHAALATWCIACLRPTPTSR